MWQYLLHLWAIPPVALQLACPASPSGAVANSVGFFDDMSVASAYSLAAAASAAVVTLGVAACYLWTRMTLGPAFKVRWVIFLVGTSLVTGAAVFLVLKNASTHAFAGTCASDPSPFVAPLPLSVVTMRAIAGVVWGFLAFLVVAWFGTFTIGRWAGQHNGFFHNRAWPWPRALMVK